MTSENPVQFSDSSNNHNQKYVRDIAIENYKKKFTQHRIEQRRLREMHDQMKVLQQEFRVLQRHIRAFLIGSQMTGEVLKRLSDNKFVVKTMNGPRYVVGIRTTLVKEEIDIGTRVTLDTMTYSIMRILPKEVDCNVYTMTKEDPGDVGFDDVGGLYEQIRTVREVIELPIKNPNLFKRVGITPPKGCLLYGPPGTGKTLVARLIAKQMNCHFLKVVSSSIVDKYIGESARLIRDMFAYAKDHQPCIIFMDEIDAIGGRRFSDGSSADREIQRTLMELLNQMDGFDSLGTVKIIMATNRPDTLDPALLRPGRIDRKIHIDLPNSYGRLEIFKIYTRSMNIQSRVNYDILVKMSEGFNGADIRNVCTEAGLFAIRNDRDHVIYEDFIKSLRKMEKVKKLETKLDYNPI